MDGCCTGSNWQLVVNLRCAIEHWLSLYISVQFAGLETVTKRNLAKHFSRPLLLWLVSPHRVVMSKKLFDQTQKIMCLLEHYTPLAYKTRIISHYQKIWLMFWSKNVLTKYWQKVSDMTIGLLQLCINHRIFWTWLEKTLPYGHFWCRNPLRLTSVRYKTYSSKINLLHGWQLLLFFEIVIHVYEVYHPLNNRMMCIIILPTLNDYN